MLRGSILQLAFADACIGSHVFHIILDKGDDPLREVYLCIVQTKSPRNWQILSQVSESLMILVSELVALSQTKS